MKKLLALTLAFVLCLALTVPALAADTVVPSPQALVFDGYGVEDFSVYNINGYNYFKLRDIAALMSGTAGEFSVEWDAETGTAAITTGGSYAFAGGELTSDKDQSASAVPSPQTVLIDGEACDTISIYNIGGYNYFKLRDLGEALGFGVDYDGSWNTAIIAPPQAEYLMVSEAITADGSTATITFTYDENGRPTGYTADDGSSNAVLTYNDHGVVIYVKSFGGEGEDAWEFETSYNGRGAVTGSVSRSAYSTDVSEYTYNSLGVLLREYSESVSETDSYTHEYVYNDQGLLIRTVDTSAAADGTGETGTTTYTYDKQGRVVAYNTAGSGKSLGIDFDENGEWVEVLESFRYTEKSRTVYQSDRSTETMHYVYTDADGSESVIDSVGVTVYDADGNILSRKDTNVINGESEIRERRYTYNAAGDVLTDAEYIGGSETADSAETYTYDAAGRLLSYRRESGNGDYSCMTYTYDAAGNCIADSYETRYTEYDWETETSSAVVEKTSSSTVYDQDGRPVLYTSDSNGEHYERALSYDTDGNLTRETVKVNGKLTETTVYTYQRTA